MVDLSSLLSTDPTLEAADRALEDGAAKEMPRPYLGMSEIGESCPRKIWYKFRFSLKEKKKAFLIKCGERGHRAEELQAARLRMVGDVSLTTVDPLTGKQFEFSDLNGHFKGHYDGEIIGLLQAPKTPHVWEHKEKEEKFVNKLKKIKSEVGEKLALRNWDAVYFAQAILYMFYKSLTRHYMTVSVPGGRETISIRTDCDTAFAMQLREKARRIIEAQEPPERIGKEDYFECRFCNFSDICHKDEMPDRSCRTCLHATPTEDGQWHCQRWGKNLTLDEQISGCPAHLFIPALVPGEIISTDQEKNSITYRMKNGEEWTDSEVG